MVPNFSADNLILTFRECFPFRVESKRLKTRSVYNRGKSESQEWAFLDPVLFSEPRLW